MDQFKNSVTNFDNNVRNWLSIIDSNEYITAALTLFLIIYAACFVQKMPQYILRLFDHPIVKLLIFFFIVYTAKKNPAVAIIAAVALMASIHALNKMELDQVMMVMLTKERERMTDVAEYDMTNAPRPSNELVMEHVTHQEASMHPASLMDLQEENKSEPMNDQKGCGNIDYKNSFYPQYANMKQDAYIGMFDGNSVGGFDPDAAYASI